MNDERERGPSARCTGGDHFRHGIRAVAQGRGHLTQGAGRGRGRSLGGIQAQGLRPVYDRAKLPLSYLLVRPSLLRDVTLRALGLKYLCTLLRVALGRVRKRRHRSVTFDLNPLGFFLRKK